MRIAYIISAYRLPTQLVRLIDRLDDGGAEFLIHIDLRQSAVMRAVSELVRGRSNVLLLPPHRCYWGDFGHVRATLKGIDALRRARRNFDYVVLLTGQDYPIKPVSAIREFLAAASNRIFLNHFALPSTEWRPRGGLDRIEYPHFRVLGRTVRLPVRRALPGGLRPFGGSAYWVMPNEAIRYVDSLLHDHPEYVDFFRRVRVPDEIFFQTLLLNSPYVDRIVDDDLHYTVWVETSPRPLVLTCNDMEALQTTPALFARKFDIGVDEHVLDLIDTLILQR